jgi:hypothetical protein
VWVSVERAIAAPPDAIWPWLTSPECLARVLGHAELIAPGDREDPSGVGSHRRLAVGDLAWEDVVVAVEEPVGFATKLVMDGRAARFGSRVSLEARGDETLVRWTQELPGRGVLERAAAERALAPRLCGALDALEAALAGDQRIQSPSSREPPLNGERGSVSVTLLGALEDGLEEEAAIAHRLATQGSLLAPYAELHVARTRAELAACARGELPHREWCAALVVARASAWRDAAARHARFQSVPAAWARVFAGIEALPRAPVVSALRAIAVSAEAHARASHRDDVASACRAVGACSPSRFRGDDLLLASIESEALRAALRRTVPEPFADALAKRLLRPASIERRRAFEAVAHAGCA